MRQHRHRRPIYSNVLIETDVHLSLLLLFSHIARRDSVYSRQKSYTQKQYNMVSHSIPMGYESLRTVLLHTDPNLSQSYKLGVYRHYSTEDITRSIKMDNINGGVSCDLDQYGFEVPNSSTTILNGDVSFRTENAADRRNDTEETELHYRFSLKRHKNYLAKINYDESRGKTRFNKAGLQMMMDACRSKLLPFNYRRNNLSPPYTCYIQLTITQEDATTIQRYEYNHKLYEAAKKLNETLFANRHVIIVNHLQSACFDVLRMPIGLKISAKVVSGDSRQLIPISSIVDSSKPLPELKINVTSESALTLQHSFVKNAVVLSIWTHKNRVDQLARAFKTMENQRVHFKFCRFDNPSANDYYQLLQGWLAIERNVGSMITFELNADHIGESILELVRNQNEITESTDRCVTVPLRNATKLEVFYAPLHEDENVSRFFFEKSYKIQNQNNMVSHTVPMGYESLRTVLLHTDPNLRFKIAQRIPKIRLTEKAVPLRIRCLELEESTTKVNSQSYKLGVYRHYHTEDIPMGIKNRNKWGGVSCDLDQYGFEIPNSFDPILNGDVSFRREIATDRRRDTEEREQRLQFSLRRYEEALAKINQLESEGKTVDDFLAGPMNEDDQRIRRTLEIPKEQLQSGVNRYRSALLPFHYRRNNLSPPYTCYIQLTIIQGNVTNIQRYEYNHKLYEASKKLNEILFVNRSVIIADHFQNTCADVLRTPIGFKIFANNVYGYNFQIIPMSSIVDSSRALPELSISVTSGVVSNFSHSLVKNAETLSIYINEGRINQLAIALETMENQHIHIQFGQFDNPSPNEYFQLLHGWLATERSVGLMITSGLKTDQIGEEILELVRNGNERTQSTDGSVTVLRSNATILEVFYVPNNEEENLSRFILAARIKRA
ncbi:hypothetical protein L3Y34_019161 [Caenorhabditis briggsae]|uniref:Uncharacterized protein n=1 Tax=Caenorhabditis briggsae TaxID=6238 RepID=A0AAE9DP52_CAEBR|nr:hypothetical protein L3Y34_019161 [Caenorhabditis briggsae]